MRTRPRSGTLSTESAAQLAGISIRHLRRLLSEGKAEAPAKNADGSLRWTVLDVETLKLAVKRPRRRAA